MHRYADKDRKLDEFNILFFVDKNEMANDIAQNKG